MIKNLIKLGSIMTAASLALLAHAAPERPNIVVVLADDMGWGDSGTYGHELIQTPNMDRLAARGMKFTQAYSAAGVCSPSRSAVLTGRTPYRNGVWQHLSGVHPTHLRSSEVTYPELLREIGYETCHVGKWHLLPRQQYANPEFPQVGVQGGYDYWFATQNNADPSHQNPDNFYRNGAALGLLEGYSAPLVADEAIHWLKDLRNPEKPFVLSVWFHEPHKPIATDVKFADLYGDHKNKVYMGNISQMDYALGQLLNTLDEIGATENTLIFFSSDNGPVRSEGGSTGGLRGGKRSSYEGGIRVPGIMSWPGHITPGAETNTPIIGTDIFTTVLDIVGLLVPSDRTIDGVSLLPVFEGKSVTRTTPLYWRTHVSSPTERSAIRIGEWKLISNDLMTEFELYNIAADPEEAKDLAAQMPEKTEKLKRELFKVWNSIEDEGPREWWRECQTKPIRNGNLAY